jgi:hypothetical protein
VKNQHKQIVQTRNVYGRAQAENLNGEEVLDSETIDNRIKGVGRERVEVVKGMGAAGRALGEEITY